MRFHISEQFAAAVAAWQAAYTTHDAIGSDPDIPDGDPTEREASDAEYATLESVLAFTASTPTEVAQKLRIMRDRGVEDWSDYPRYLGQIERDLIELQRPCVSTAMASVFDHWREANRANHEDLIGEDKQDARLCKAHSEAFLALMAVPCITPGDFIVKVYANLLGEHGSTFYGRGRKENGFGGFPFELDSCQLGGSGGTHDDAAAFAITGDIAECDLGRCLLSLGRVDFHAADWLRAAHRAKMTVHVVIQPDGSRGLWTGEAGGEVDVEPLHAERWHRCQALIAGGLGIVGAERRRAVVELIEAEHPTLVMDCRSIETVAAA